ncbi:MAG: DUF3426 domain-containing protein [Trichloromonas sp.]|jgi:predicted Zn finger-like uncharacterized protein|nr:DUF3426 domain-containing protein [Trichloromonas sp.]
MIIQCPECSTRFKLADDKLKPEGIKVRCAKCRHIFTLLPPEPDDTVAEAEGRPSTEHGEAEDPWAESFNEMLDDASPEDAPAEQGESSWDEALESSFADVGAAISEPGPTEEEEEQEFSPDPLEPSGATGGDLDAVGLGLDEEEPTPVESGLSFPSFTPEPLISEDLFGESTPPVEEDAPGEPAAPAADVDEFQFEEVGEDEEFAFEDTPDSELDPFAAASASDESPIDKTEDPDDNLFPAEPSGGETIAGFSFQEEGVEAFSFAPEKAESGDTFAFEEDDLFASEMPASVADSIFDETPPEKTLYPDGLPEAEDRGFEFSEMEGSVAIDRSAEEMPIPVTTSRPAAERLPSSAIDELPEPLSEPRPKAAEPKRGPLATVLRIFVLLLLLLAASAGYLIWRGGANSLPQILGQLQNLTGTASPTEPAVHIRLPLPNSFFVMNQHAGQLFVIQGEAVNGYPEPRSAISVTGMLHDAKGDVLLRQTVFCGNPMDLETLKSAPFDTIQEILSNPFGSALANVNIAPDTSIPYMIVFRDLPDNVTHFTVEVADSKVGEGR